MPPETMLRREREVCSPAAIPRPVPPPAATTEADAAPPATAANAPITAPALRIPTDPPPV